MPAIKGSPKPANSGRKKGTPNKSTQTVAEILAKLKCDPIEGLAKIAMESEDEAIRVKCYSELARYRYPQLKAIEHSGPGGSPIQFNVSATDELRSRIAGILNRRGT
jgi:hypothetical protein